jgi:hypothetical protein
VVDLDLIYAYMRVWPVDFSCIICKPFMLTKMLVKLKGCKFLSNFDLALQIHIHDSFLEENTHFCSICFSRFKRK